MSLSGALWTRLQAVTGVTDLVSTRIWPSKNDITKPTFPYVTWELVAAERPSAFGSDTGDVEASVRYHVWAETTTAKTGYDSADDVIEAIRVALQRFRGTLDSTEIQDIFVDGQHTATEPAPNIHHHIIDFRVWYKE